MPSKPPRGQSVRHGDPSKRVTFDPFNPIIIRQQAVDDHEIGLQKRTQARVLAQQIRKVSYTSFRAAIFVLSSNSG